MRYELSRTASGWVVGRDSEYRRIAGGLDDVLTDHDPVAHVAELFGTGEPAGAPTALLAPIGSQEVWAAGVTYLRSRVARVAESKQAGGDTFYDLVYDAPRPELFFKATPHRVVGPGSAVRIRGDSTWNVPEPEFTLVISAAGKVVGATIGNDMSSRSIEGENPLYLPQAKVYASSAALGPSVVLTDEPFPSDTEIAMSIARDGETIFTGSSALDRIKRSFEELVEHLFRDNEFPAGSFLMTGTGIVPDDGFTLASGDVVTITVDGLGTLVNPVG
ncbi:MAG TPA: fumarylacetoacetate hydrolase family protein [Ilumatobacteraceae bacterium]|nr:fumarylacetoacetate hydrolase family protein [Ilumatobacteraceae bacterium]